MEVKPAIFFDRDGVLNREVHYLHRIEEFVWIEGAVAAVRWARERGYWTFVVTNQSGVGRGYYPEADVRRLHDWMNESLRAQGTAIDAFFYCPHYPDGAIAAYAGQCDCRKPKPGLIVQARRRYAIDMAKSLLIGDRESDMECARNAGLRGVKFSGGNLAQTLRAAIVSE